MTSPYWENYYYANTVDLIVTTPGGTSTTSAADQFTYTNPPTVSNLDLSSGFTLGGDLVTISGDYLDNVSAVDFGQTAGTIVSDNFGQIQAISPAGAIGTVDVTVVTPGGTSSTSSADRFTYVALPPVVEGLSQSTGSTAGGTTVTITGANLGDASAVDFDDTNFADDLGPVAGTIVSDTYNQVVVTRPAGIAGTVDVTVTTAGGTSGTSPVDQFTYITAPAVDSLGSSTGPAAGGGTVYIYGSELQGASAVNFGQTAGTIVADGSTYVIAAAPAGTAGTVDVTVTTPYGTSATSMADQFTYVAPPTTAAASYTLDEGSTLTVAGPGVLAGDLDPQGLALSAELLTNPVYGTLSFGADGSFTYTPESGYFGTDSFTYQADDGYVVSNPTTVSLTILESNSLATPVTNNSDSGPGSLRQAMLNAAADTSGDLYTIQFALPAGPQTINLLSPLPAVSDPLIFLLDATQNIAIAASPANASDNYNGLTKAGEGTLTLAETGSFDGNIAIQGGTLDLDEPATPTFATGTGITISNDGALVLSGSVSDLSPAVNITNNSTAAAGVEVSGTNQVFGALSGTGNMVLDSGGNQTVTSIDQNTLSIGAGATVTIAPSGGGSSTVEDSATSDSQSTVSASGTVVAERIAALAARRAEAMAAILALERSQTPAAMSTIAALTDSSSSAAPLAVATILPPTPVAALTTAQAEPTTITPAATISVSALQVTVAAPSQSVAGQEATSSATLPTVVAISSQATAVVPQSPVESPPNVQQESLGQVGFAARGNAAALAMFVANFSQPVASNPLPTAADVAVIGSEASAATANSAVALASLNTSTARFVDDAVGRSALHGAIDAALEDGASPIFAFDESLLDLLASELLRL